MEFPDIDLFFIHIFIDNFSFHVMIVADVTFYPIGTGVSAGKVIKGAIEKLKEGNIKCYPNSMATVIESETMDDLLLHLYDKGVMPFYKLFFSNIHYPLTC